MKTNYHTHTYRCGHAKGSEEDMVLSAIQLGLKELGICCHIPFPHYRRHLLNAIPAIRSLKSAVSLIRTMISGGPTMRMAYKDIDEHLNKIEECQKKYKDSINVYKGFEAEGLEEYFGYYQDLLSSQKVDYLILGHHFHKYCIHGDYYGRTKLPKKAIYEYADDIEKALETGLFSYLAHPDLFLMGYHDYGEDMQRVSRRICEKAKELNIPLEINAGGIRRGKRNINGEEVYLYTNTHFYKIAGEVGNDVIIGIDAHDPKDFNKEIYEELEQFAKDHHLHLIDQITFLKGKQKDS